MVGDLSGSIGSTTASRNKFGSYFRQKVVPVNPNTTRQQDVRAIFATLVNAWTNTLTQAERDDWSNWAANTTINGADGQPINITGQNAYVRFNTVRLQIGGVRVDVAPVAFNNGSPPTSIQTTLGVIAGSIGVDIVAMKTTVNLAGDASDDGDVALWIGGPINASRNFFKGPYQLMSSEPIAQGADFVDFATAAVDQQQQIGLIVDQFRGVKIRVCYDDGRLSEDFSVLAPVIDDAV